MIIDCFTYFNEEDILECRLNILNDYVDKFVLVEASHTQTLIEKPFYFDQNRSRFGKFLDKIVHIKVVDTPSPYGWAGRFGKYLDRIHLKAMGKPSAYGWAMENYQRNCINHGLAQVKLGEDDIIVISDLDEIWNPERLEEIRGNVINFSFTSARLKYFTFSLDLLVEDIVWIGSVFCHAGRYIKGRYTPQKIRNKKESLPRVEHCGWHLGYMGGFDIVYNKYLSCVEPLDKSCLPPKEEFRVIFNERIRDGGSFIFSDNLPNQSVKLRRIDMQKEHHPYVYGNLEKYRHLLIESE